MFKRSRLNDFLWWTAGFAVAADALILATMVDLGRIDDVAIGIVWFTLGAPFLILASAHAAYAITRWVAVPIVERRMLSLVWLDDGVLAARDIVMLVAMAGWLAAAVTHEAA